MSIQRFDKVTTEAPKTYAETQGKPPFDWWAFLDRAKRGKLTEEEHQSACEMALEWTTCACGNQCVVIPRGEGGMPIDEVLADLGGRFYAEVNCRCWSSAKLVLRAIEARSAKLIAELAPALELHL